MKRAITPLLRRAPLGVLLMAAMLAVVGAGSTVAGVYLLLREGNLSLWAGATSIIVGPIIVYFAYALVRLAPWTWMALAVLIGLMLASSVVRIIVSPGIPLAAVLEIGIELAALAYISRPAIRSSYGWAKRAA